MRFGSVVGARTLTACAFFMLQGSLRFGVGGIGRLHRLAFVVDSFFAFRVQSLAVFRHQQAVNSPKMLSPHKPKTQEPTRDAVKVPARKR